MPAYDSEPAYRRSCLKSSRPHGFDSLDKWQGQISHLTSLEHSKCQSEGCPRIDVLVIPGYTPWMQISSLTTLASTQHGNTLRIKNIGSTSWKLLRSSSGHARDDDDDDDDDDDIAMSNITNHNRH